jgi:HAD superfamily hydrolase (TIGR01509 family)
MSILFDILVGLIGAFLWETIIRSPSIKLISFLQRKFIWRKILNFGGDLYIAKSAIQVPVKLTREADNLVEHEILSNVSSKVNIIHEDPSFNFTNPNTNMIILGGTKYNKYAELLQRHFSVHFEYVTDSYEADPTRKIIKIIGKHGDEYISSSDLKTNQSRSAIVYGMLFYSKLKNNKNILWISGIHGPGTIGVYKYLKDHPDKFFDKIDKIPPNGKSGKTWLFRIQYDQQKDNQDTIDVIEDVELIGEPQICTFREIKHKPKILICDFGNVIMLFDRYRAYRAFGHWFGLSYLEVASIIERTELLKRYEKGELSDEEFYNKVMSLFNVNEKMPFDLFCEYWSDIFWPNRNMIEALNGLKSEVKLILLSNTNNLHFANIMEHYGEILSMFEDRIILSYKEKMAKPDMRIFQKAIQLPQCETAFENCIYVDDNIKNVEVAKELGMKGIVFYSYTQFVYAMREFGLYIP